MSGLLSKLRTRLSGLPTRYSGIDQRTRTLSQSSRYDCSTGVNDDRAPARVRGWAGDRRESS